MRIIRGAILLERKCRTKLFCGNLLPQEIKYAAPEHHTRTIVRLGVQFVRFGVQFVRIEVQLVRIGAQVNHRRKLRVCIGALHKGSRAVPSSSNNCARYAPRRICDIERPLRHLLVAPVAGPIRRIAPRHPSAAPGPPRSIAPGTRLPPAAQAPTRRLDRIPCAVNLASLHLQQGLTYRSPGHTITSPI